MIYLRLFWEFFKTGLFAVGGGMATLPFLYDISDRTGWFSRAQLADMLAVSESTPGPIGVNMATYAGFLCGGAGGAVIATLGLIAPSLLIILAIAAFLQKLRGSRYVEGAFYGLRPASAAMILAALVLVARATFFTDGLALSDWRMPIMAAALFALTDALKATRKLHPVVFIAASAAAGAALRLAE